MTGAAIKLEVDDEKVQKKLARMIARGEDLSPALKVIGEILRTSAVKNFLAGGRPKKWAPLSEVTKKRRKGTAILRIQGLAGGLMGSVSWRALKDQVIVGTNKIYGAVHQFGAKKGQFGTVIAARKMGRAGRSGATVYSRGYRQAIPWGDIPARPFLMIQDEDWPEINDALAGHVTKGD